MIYGLLTPTKFERNILLADWKLAGCHYLEVSKSTVIANKLLFTVMQVNDIVLHNFCSQ